MFTPFAFIQPITTVTPITPVTSAQYLLLGGQFTLYNSPSTNRIAKIDQNGDLILDSSFNIGVGFNGVVNDIKQQPDGKYVMTGAFTTYSGSTTTRIVRINQNSTLDTTFAANGTLNNLGYSVLPFSDNSILIGGNFTTYVTGSTTLNVNRVIKFNSSGAIDPTFNTGFGFNSVLTTFATQSDGKIIAVGLFSQYSQSNNCITRTDISGSLNSGPGTSFNQGIAFNSNVYTFATQSDGKILAAGNFTTYSGSSALRLVRINPDGTRDTSFVSGVGFNSDVYTIKVQTDGKIIVGGIFTTYSGSTVNYITRLNPSGSIDSTFNTGVGASATVWKAHIQGDGKIVMVGNFSNYSGSSSPGIVRINDSGSKDTTFNVGTGTVGAVYTLTPTGSQYIIGGNFTVYNGVSSSYIARINSDGTRDTSFNIGTGFTSTVYGTAVDSDGKILAAGNFTTYSGSTSYRLVRINPDGTRDTSFDVGTAGFSSFSSNPSHLSVESDGKIYAGSNFTTYSGSLVNYFARINSNGTLDTTFEYTNTASSAGFDAGLVTLLVSSSNIYFGGTFTAYKPTKGIIRLNTDGTWDNTFRIGEALPAGNQVEDVLVEPNDKIVFVGGFTTYSGSSSNTNRLIRLNPNGTLDPTFVTGTGPNGTPYSITRRPDGKFVIIGAQTSYNGSPTISYIVGINQSGSRDTTFNVGSGIGSISVGTKALKVISTPDNKIYVTAPLATSYSGSTSGNIYRINPSGTLDTTFNPIYPGIFNRSGLGFVTDTGNPGGYSMILSGSSVIVGGNFTAYKAPFIARGVMIDSTGAVSSSFNMGATGFDVTVRTWATQSDGKILAGGDFTQYSGSTTNTVRMVRINRNGTLDPTFVTGAGFNSTVSDIRVQSDGKIIAVGQFTTYSGSTVNGIVRLNVSGTRDTSFNIGAGFTLGTQGNNCKIQSDGKIIVVGAFTTYSGSSTTRIVRINTDGTRDTTFNVGTGTNNSIEAIILQSDEKPIITGNFTTYSGSSINRIVRINTDGTRDTSFNVGTGLAGAGYAVALQSDGKIVCSTLTTTTYSGSTARSILRINTDGTLDTSFGFYPPVAGFSSTSNTPNSLAIANDGKIYWGNSFTTYSGSTPNRIVRLNTDGAVDQTFNQAFPNYVNNTGKGANSTINAILLI